MTYNKYLASLLILGHFYPLLPGGNSTISIFLRYPYCWYNNLIIKVFFLYFIPLIARVSPHYLARTYNIHNPISLLGQIHFHFQHQSPIPTRWINTSPLTHTFIYHYSSSTDHSPPPFMYINAHYLLFELHWLTLSFYVQYRIPSRTSLLLYFIFSSSVHLFYIMFRLLNIPNYDFHMSVRAISASHEIARYVQVWNAEWRWEIYR